MSLSDFSMTTGLSAALPVMLHNVFTANLVARTAEWPHNYGLCAYSGTVIGGPTRWFFLQYQENYFKITNQKTNTCVIANSGGEVRAHDGGDYPDQYWSLEPVAGASNVVRILNRMYGVYLYDPNPPGTTGTLSCGPVKTANETRWNWKLFG